MATQKLIDLVKNQRVHFEYYRDKELWYKTDSGFLFPVPISDAGTATFLKEDKAILFMRYIRKYKDEMDKEVNDEGFIHIELFPKIGTSISFDDIRNRKFDLVEKK